MVEVGHLRARGRCEQPHRQRHALFCSNTGLLVKGTNDPAFLSSCSSLGRGLQDAV